MRTHYDPRGRSGRNYGWRIREGAHPNPLYDDTTADVLIDPVIAYTHATGRSVTGGVVYRGQDLNSALAGRYFFGDIIGRVWSAHFVIAGDGEVASADVQEHTEALCRLYIVSLSGTVFRVASEGGGNADCSAPGAVPRLQDCAPPVGTGTRACPADARRPRGG